MYFKKTLDKLGVDRGSGARRQVQRLRRHVHAHGHEPGNPRSDRLAGGRSLRQPGGAHRRRRARNRRDDVRAIIDRGPFTAPRRCRPGWWTNCASKTRCGASCRTACIRRTAPGRLGNYAKVPADSLGLGGKSRIALLVAQGDIVRGSPGRQRRGRIGADLVRLRQAAAPGGATIPPSKAWWCASIRRAARWWPPTRCGAR